MELSEAVTHAHAVNNTENTPLGGRIYVMVLLYICLPINYSESCPLIALLPRPSGHAGRSRSGLNAQRTIEAKD